MLWKALLNPDGPGSMELFGSIRRWNRRSIGMDGSTAGFADRLFGLPNQIAIRTIWRSGCVNILTHDLLRPNCTTPNSNGCVSLRNGNLRRAFSINLGKCHYVGNDLRPCGARATADSHF